MIQKISLILLSLIAASPIEAQIMRRAPRSADPAMWIGLGAGIMNGNGINDGRTSSTWDFGQGSSWQYRGSIEKAIQNQSAVGLTGTYAKVPFTYTSSIAGPQTCTRCDAHLDMLGLALSFHAGGGAGFHQVLEGSAGVTHFRNLTRDSDKAKLAPVDGNTDFSLAFGYGFGYNFNPSAEVFLVQDYGLVLHERDGLGNSDSNTLTIRTTRAGFRLGRGARRPVR